MSKPASYYVIVKRDFTKTKNAIAVQPAFTDKRNALEAMEDYIFSCVAEADGLEYAKRCLIDESMHMKFIASRLEEQKTACSVRSIEFLKASMKERETELKENGFARLDNGKFNPNEGYVISESRFTRKVVSFPKKHFITREIDGSTDRLTVWRKYDIERVVPGKVWGTKTLTETLVEKQFSVEVIAIPSNVLWLDHKSPNVTYQASWYQALYLPKNMTEDQYIEKERKDLASDFSACLATFDAFTSLLGRFPDEEDIDVYDDAEPINLPRMRYEFAEEFAYLPNALQYEPEPEAPVEIPVEVAVAEVEVAVVAAPVVPIAVEVTAGEDTSSPKDNIPESK
jgi:hypothetical protein